MYFLNQVIHMIFKILILRTTSPQFPGVANTTTQNIFLWILTLGCFPVELVTYEFRMRRSTNKRMRATFIMILRWMIFLKTHYLDFFFIIPFRDTQITARAISSSNLTASLEKPTICSRIEKTAWKEKYPLHTNAEELF